MKIYNGLFSFLLLLVHGVSLPAQTNLPCGTDEHLKIVFATRPDLAATYQANQQRAEEEDREAAQRGYVTTRSNQPPVYTIAVVFHIIHNYGYENISDAQILDALRILNEDFRKTNSDITTVDPTFQNITGDAEIEFRLANIDPNGNCTNGIDRIASLETYVGDDYSKLNAWPRTHYLNIWVVKNISTGAAGYAYPPGTAPFANADGVMMMSQYVGSIGTGSPGTSRALTHEVGHFFNLQHPWGSVNPVGVTCGDDGVSDTPITQGWTSCAMSSNAICNISVVENVQNYMEYSYCSCMFTAGQCARMRTALQSTMSQRDQLVLNASSVINDPMNACAPVADFWPKYVWQVCAGQVVNFTEHAFNGQVTSWSWSFPGGSPSSSTSPSPSIQYNTVGSYNVSLTVSNAQGTNTTTRTGVIVVVPPTAQYQTLFEDGFEDSTRFNNEWVVINDNGNAFERTSQTAYTDTSCVMLENLPSMYGQRDELDLPTVDLSSIPNAAFTFQVAYAQRTYLTVDTLRVLVSLDCGATWQMRFIKYGSILATVPYESTYFLPATSMWRSESVFLNAAIRSSPNVRFKFQFTSNGGNNIFIDDVRIGTPVGMEATPESISDFEVFPNPASQNAFVSFSMLRSESLRLEVVDLTGRVVEGRALGDLSPGAYTIPVVADADLPSGMYLVRMVGADGRSVSRKLFVE